MEFAGVPLTRQSNELAAFSFDHLVEADEQRDSQSLGLYTGRASLKGAINADA
jgi:hypothetical protein